MIDKFKIFFINNKGVPDISHFRTGVCNAYSEAAANPRSKHPFPVGRWFAESIGYPEDSLDFVPGFVSETFTGVSNVSIFAEIPEGSMVLDVGCGAGLDSFIASQKAGLTGQVIGIDFSNPMLEKATKASNILSQPNVSFYRAAAEKLPLSNESIDVILVNGIFNLNPFRHDIFTELARVIKPGGSVYAAELVFKKPQRPKKVCDIRDWFAWIAGAKDGVAFLNEFKEVGFRSAEILKTSSNARTKHKNIVAAEVFAKK